MMDWTKYWNNNWDDLKEHMCGARSFKILSRGQGGKCCLRSGHQGKHEDFYGNRWSEIEADK